MAEGENKISLMFRVMCPRFYAQITNHDRKFLFQFSLLMFGSTIHGITKSHSQITKWCYQIFHVKSRWQVRIIVLIVL